MAKNKIKPLTIAELKIKAKKQCWSKVNYFWHIAGLYLAKPLLKTPISANQITTAWLILELLAAILLLGGYWSRVSAILIMNFLVNLLDYTDGNIARARSVKTYRGMYLEYMGVYIGMPLFLLFLGVGIFLREGSILALIFGMISCISLLYEKLFNINPSWYEPEQWSNLHSIYLTSSLSKKNSFSYLSELFRKTQPFNLLFFGIIFDFLKVTLIIYTVISVMLMIKKIVQQNIGIGKLDKAVKNTFEPKNRVSVSQNLTPEETTSPKSWGSSNTF